jgi:rhodanese-related sulfurtransferase
MIDLEPQPQNTIAPRELQRLVAGGVPAELLDVRTPAEHAAAHVPGAKLVPLAELDATVYLQQRAPDSGPLYVLCQSGGRARRAIAKFEQAGFHGCVLVQGGTEGWIDAGLPVNRS